MDIWLNEHTKEHTSEEINDHTLIKKDKDGQHLGIEIISLSTLAKAP